LLLLLLVVVTSMPAQQVTRTVQVGQGPLNISVNPVTNKAYIANVFGNSVSVLDGATNTVTTVPVGISPWAVAVNPATNKIYSADGVGTVTVIDGATNASIAITLASPPEGIVADAETNRIYAMCPLADSVAVIDGATNTVMATVPVGDGPSGIALNPVTNKIYVSNRGYGGAGHTVTVIDGATNATTTVEVGYNPLELAVNPVSNKIYVTNALSNSVTEIDGATNVPVTVNVGANPIGIAIDTVRNKVYVANLLSNTVTVIDGTTHATATVNADVEPRAIAVDTLTGQVYVVNFGDGTSAGTVTVITEGTNATRKLKVGAGPQAVAVNPITGKVYVADTGTSMIGQIGSTVSVIDTAVNTSASVSVGYQYTTSAVNPATNLIYTAEFYSTVNIVDGNTNIATPVQDPSGYIRTPGTVAVNPVTNKIYVEDIIGSHVTLIDGGTGKAVASIPTGGDPSGIAVNPVTNKIYATDDYGDDITVIDGATNATVKLASVCAAPQRVVVNSITNKIYAVCSNASTSMLKSGLAVIDGAMNAVTVLDVGLYPEGIGINPVTNRIYLTREDGTILMVDGATNAVTTLYQGALGGENVAVNVQTNKIYVLMNNYSTGANVVMIDGATNVITPLTVGGTPYDLVVDQFANKVYFADYFGSVINVLDGATNTLLSPAPGADLGQYITLNPFNGRAFETGRDGKLWTLFPNTTQTVPLTTSVSGMVDNLTVGTDNVFQTVDSGPSFNVTVTSQYGTSSAYNSSITNPPATAVYYQVDGGSSQWQHALNISPAGANPSSFKLSLSNMAVGLHILYAYAAYGNEAGPVSTNADASATPELSNVTACYFLIMPSGTPRGTVGTPPACPLNAGSLLPTVTTLSSSANPQSAGANIVFTAAVSPAAATSKVPTGTIFLYDGGVLLTSVAAGSGTVTLNTAALTVGTHSMTAVYSGDGVFAPSVSVPISEVITGRTTTTAVSAAPNPADEFAPVTIKAIVTSASGTPGGTANFLDGTTQIGTATLSAAGEADFTTSSLAIGLHSLSAVYAAQGMYAASTSLVVPETILAPSTTTTLTASQATAYVLQPVTLTAKVTAASGIPSGTVTFYDGKTSIGTVALNAAATAVLTVAGATAPGLHAFTAVSTVAPYADSISTAVSTNFILIPTTLTLSSSLNPAYQSQLIEFAGVVETPVNAPPAAGQVTFYDGTTILGSVAFTAGQAIRLQTSAMLPGTHNLSAVFDQGSLPAQENLYLPSQSAPLTQTVLESSFVVGDVTLAVKTQHHAVVTIQVTANGVFSDTVALRCGDLPMLVTCEFQTPPMQVAANGANVQTFKLYVDTSAVVGYARNQTGAKPVLAMLWIPGMLGGIVLCIAGRRARGSRIGLLLCLLFVGITMMACSGKLPDSTPPGTYSIPIRGSGLHTGMNATGNLTLTVTP
jgi:YVTN family beta-propeller protein